MAGFEVHGYKVGKLNDYSWEIPVSVKQGMNVPARIFASEKLLKEMDPGVFDQITNVACLPGIQKAAMAMSDAHWGYGFPIGGVAAFDLEEGIISPGGIGFDINCIYGGAKILSEFGYTKNMIDFEGLWQKEIIKCSDFSNEVTGTTINAFMKSLGKKAYKITTETGKEIIASSDHRFYTKNGMKKVSEMENGFVAVFPFEGNEFEKPKQKLLVDEKIIRKAYKGNENGFNQIIKFLKGRGLLPIYLDSEKLPYLAKICGFVQGDGTLQFFKKGDAAAHFYGKKEDLETIKADIKKLGFESQIYSRNRHHKFETYYGISQFDYLEHSLHCSSTAFALLLKCLGCTAGNKVKQEWFVPEWILSSTKWLKRLYLAAFFGAELTTPKTVTRHGYNFYNPTLSLNKKLELRESGWKLLGQIQSMLDEFCVASSTIAEREEFTNKIGEISVRQRLQVSAEPENLIRFWSRIGFEYNAEKTFLANAAIAYLQIKEMVIEQREKSSQIAIELKQQGFTLKEVHEQIGNEFVNERFIARSIWGGRKTGARVASKFRKFDEFIKERIKGLGKTGFVWEKVASIEETEFNDYLYDFNVANENHNFIANGFLSSNCGMRLVLTDLTAKEVQPKIKELVNTLFEKVPVGVGRKGSVKLDRKNFDELMVEGVNWCIENGYGWEEDAKKIEEHGAIKGANPGKVSEKARQRGISQLGTLGSGNHYLEVQLAHAENIFDAKAAKALGIHSPEQVVVMVHCGSRGFGHQIATDYLVVFEKAMQKYGINVKDRQLACAPFNSKEGKDYYSAMVCAANSAFCNRQVIVHQIRESFKEVFRQDPEKMGMHIVYDVAHNIAKVEEHVVEGKKKKLVVHRKGATRSFAPGHEELWGVYKEIGQPVIVGGSMETGSYVCVGTQKAMDETFGSTMHGSGRTMSRAKAKKIVRGDTLQKDMEKRGIYVKAASYSGLAEEAGLAYKNISEVVDSMDKLGVSRKVAALSPIGNIKG
ncbi:MAG: hypothetical protein QT03_C0001G0851 [archaeon GW2011_AR10]|uniref:tRNA-splicing ligase RtcB n=2 Tax=Candidatus Iainarchaeum sp. TaxID=3101447 RepID=A0A7J4IS88_9ARCH|nr:MAG: hypothetical protein QT03_C0001G0851 [archaeon GW2011_AR10]HIH08322.1 RNA-splicing ligase RtcB [Candidatus Diapherotrites archaeon]